MDAMHKRWSLLLPIRSMRGGGREEGRRKTKGISRRAVLKVHFHLHPLRANPAAKIERWNKTASISLNPPKT